jgi:energy-coupling factor transporter ATP-binding protein EcfA2
LRDPDPWFDGLPTAMTSHPTFDRQLMAQRLRKLEAVIDVLFPAHQMHLFRQLVEQVVVGKDSFVVRVNPQGIFDLMTELLDEDYLKELQTAQSGPVAE